MSCMVSGFHVRSCQELSCPDVCKDFKQQIAKIRDPTKPRLAFLVGLSKKSLWIMEVPRCDLEYLDLTTATAIGKQSFSAAQPYRVTIYCKLCSALAARLALSGTLLKLVLCYAWPSTFVLLP